VVLAARPPSDKNNNALQELASSLETVLELSTVVKY